MTRCEKAEWTKFWRHCNKSKRPVKEIRYNNTITKKKSIKEIKRNQYNN